MASPTIFSFSKAKQRTGRIIAMAVSLRTPSTTTTTTTTTITTDTTTTTTTTTSYYYYYCTTATTTTETYFCFSLTFTMSEIMKKS